MLTKRSESRSAATLLIASCTVSPGTKRCTTLRVTGIRSAVCRSPCDRLAARITGLATLSKTDISGLHVRVVVVGGRDERLLDGASRRPAQQVQRRAGLVVGARRPRPTERLLTHHRARGL